MIAKGQGSSPEMVFQPVLSEEKRQGNGTRGISKPLTATSEYNLLRTDVQIQVNKSIYILDTHFPFSEEYTETYN